MPTSHDTYDSLLQKIGDISIMQFNRDLFLSLCGLKLEIYRLNGTPLHIDPSSIVSLNEKKTKKKKFSALDPSKFQEEYYYGNYDQNHPIQNEEPVYDYYIREDILAQIKSSHKPQIFVSHEGLKKIAVPIIYREEIIGMIVTAESGVFRFAPAQIKIVTEILQNFTNYMVENELTPLNVNIYKEKSVTKQKELLTRVLKYIKNNYHSNSLTLKEVSNNSGVSYHHLSRMFKKELNTTFGQFRNKVRLEAALKLLEKSSLSITQISYTCGFDDPAYFSKVFRTAYSVSPIHFRISKTMKESLDQKLLNSHLQKILN